MAVLNPVLIRGKTISDAWHQCLYKITDENWQEYAREYDIDRGSFEKQHSRREFDHITVHIEYPGTRPLIPIIDVAGIPPPTDQERIDKYMPYLLTGEKEPNEDYTYGERLNTPIFRLYDGKNVREIETGINPLEEVISIYKSGAYNTNQATLEIGMPTDITLNDPPCLRLIDTRIKYNKLNFILYFRSWDLWGGFPENLAGLQTVKEYMVQSIGNGLKDGEIIANSKGLHLYNYQFEYADAVTHRVK